MSLVAHKYTPGEMSAAELEATFAARGHTVDYLVKSLRDQIHSGTLSSFVITGPRGAGKSTVIQMVALRIRQNAELRAAWLPVVFPEEQFDIVSLRDLLAAVLRSLAKDGIASAQDWLTKVETETNDEQSQQLAITGLREVTRKEDRRLVLFVENLDTLLEDGLDDQMKGTLRRLLMTDPVMMVIGSAVHIFDALKDYDEAFFNYFGQVPLDRLDTEQVIELLRRRATFDGNEPFLRDLPNQLAKVRAIVHLSGGNPRFILMLYELLSQRQVTTIVQYLRRLVDELTPLLKDEMENLPAQQRKIIHALMEKGGTAQPTDLTGPTRLPLNAITTQLKRLKDAQIVEVLGGGKGRAANYTVPDKLFSIWYQMRYLSQNRRRIEVFVEVLRVWFEEEERLHRLRSLAEKARQDAPLMLRDSATEVEYLAASLKGTRHEPLATELCINHWIKADLREAAMAYATLRGEETSRVLLDEMQAHAELGVWLVDHGDNKTAIAALSEVIAQRPSDRMTLSRALFNRGAAKEKLGDIAGAISDYGIVIDLDGAPKMLLAIALFSRGMAKHRMDDTTGAIDDYTAVINLDEAFKELLAHALASRGLAKVQAGDAAGAIEDYTTVIELDDAPAEQVALALATRGVARGEQGDQTGAINDYTAAIGLSGISKTQVALALGNRAAAKEKLGDITGAISDYSAVIDLNGAPNDLLALALFSRGSARHQMGDVTRAIDDYTAVIDLDGAPKGQLAAALFNRALAKQGMDAAAETIGSHVAVVDLDSATKEKGALTLSNGRTDLLGQMKRTATIEDFLRVVDLAITSEDLLHDAANIAFTSLWRNRDRPQAETVLRRFLSALGRLPGAEARNVTLQFLSSLALLEMKDGWQQAWQILAETPQVEVKEALQFLEPVAKILAGEDRTLLDALPPEQREFANQVLARFEAKPTG